jgi:hypothetical protein
LITHFLNVEQGVRAVAAVNYRPDGEIFDWAAYVGTGDQADVAANGDKLMAEQAATMFRDLPVELYRA